MRPLRLVALLTATLVVLASCNAAKESLTGGFLSQTARATENAGSARIEQAVEIDVEVPGAGVQDIAFTAEGAIDFANQTGFIEVDLSSMGIPGTSGTMQAQFSGTQMLFRYPEGVIPGIAGKWVRIDLAAALEDSGFDADALTGGAGGQNPAEMLDTLEDVSGKIVEVGPADVRGTATTQYDAEIDFQKVFERYGSNLGSLGVQADQLRDVLEDVVVPVSVFVDSEDLVRRVVIEMDLGELTAAAGDPGVAGSMKITQDLFDFGAPVALTQPPPEDVIEFADLMAQLQTLQQVQGS